MDRHCATVTVHLGTVQLPQKWRTSDLVVVSLNTASPMQQLLPVRVLHFNRSFPPSSLNLRQALPPLTLSPALEADGAGVYFLLAHNCNVPQLSNRSRFLAMPVDGTLPYPRECRYKYIRGLGVHPLLVSAEDVESKAPGRYSVIIRTVSHRTHMA